MRPLFGKHRSRAREEALVWLARLKRGLRQREGVELVGWLERRSHRTVIAKAAVEWHGPDVLAVLSEIFPIPPAILEPRRGPRPAWLTVAAFAGAGITLGAPIAILLASGAHRSVYTTAPEATRRLTLEDGTGVELNRGTEINVVYAARARSVLIAHGEALFKVRSEQDRPFYIHAGGRNFETAAATFDVRLTAPQRLSLTVLTGTVTALPRPKPGKAGQPILLEPLQMLVIEPDQEFGRALTEESMRLQLAWHRGI
ncbi:MAG TPA: FecR domain-containing protein [Steroidobacteraceae bacterium]|nr:FecR domain-containing protein [Steroidobacteraceae bacterium]